MIVNETAVKQILNEVQPATLVAATKYVDEKEIEKLEALGVQCFGENRVQAFLDKYEKYHGQGDFHFIGTLQPNKVKYIIDKVKLIHAVDRYSLMKEIEKQAAKHDLVMPVLIQVNIAKEESKHGFEVEEIDEVFQQVQQYKHIDVKGLMMMAPNIDETETEKYFAQTQALLQRLQKDYPMYELNQLSMGMSNDYHQALKHGATYIRIGRALFKDE
ncbi:MULTISPECIES: YggS family pyridoxal phosphate-dependent enzyme [Coprobacillaceae]|uniref:YggS family pyridoxal phosphate-dependent enzyme n=1 Tax=Coprobacillaceae TaxID=2810280 RepID=UPI000E510D22|nr:MULTISPECIES: YggS family pyridoxal phosphate-dependent enzyme [Coprobacillaceae]RHM60447.1 YggS family pyridoxal phosphate-dependent enzyme [Coprobacillus sp. AF33-1AC]RHS95852.1 YggS family pyridoxal phosphate-dependent enzyme [Erysipelatoclostridium sp. AM42-17]